MTNSARRILYLLLKLATGAVLAWVLLRKLGEESSRFDVSLYRSRLEEPGAWLLLLAALLLMPLNWLIESVKWKTIISASLEKISLSIAVRSVLSGVAFGNLAPGRATEFAGKIIFIPEGKRVAASYLHFVSGAAQLMITLLAGGLTLAFYGASGGTSMQSISLVAGFAAPVLMALLLFFYFNPEFAFRQLGKIKTFKKYAGAEIRISRSTLLLVLLLSALRYLIFSLQFLLLIAVFFTCKDYGWLLQGVFLYYFFVTLIPMFSLIEAFMRGGIAIMIFSAAEPDAMNIFISSTAIWIINIVIPSAAGYLFFLFRKLKSRKR